MTIAQASERIARAADDTDRWRWFQEFLEEFKWETPDVKHALIADPPPLTGRKEYDALLAATARYLSDVNSLPVPEWVNEPQRRLSEVHYFTDIDSMHDLADERNLDEFEQHGIRLDPIELSRA